jgi:hypothetical protein
MNEFIDKLENSELKSNTVSTREFHTATAKVGKDIIENAEYFTFDYNWWPPKSTKWYYELWNTITTPYYKAKWWLKETYWEIRYGFERMFKGYDSVDTFETFAKFIERYTKILTDLRKCHYGYPGNITEEEWDNILDEMIYHLHYMDEETVTEELEKNVPDDWSASNKTTYEILEKHKNEFFKLFSEHFFSLWD